MEELIQKLQSIHGLSADQAQGVLGTITGYIKEKFPMVAGAVDNLFQSGSNGAQNTTASGNGSLLDKISDFIPGSTGEKIEEFAKDKLGSLLGGNKTA